MIQLAGVFEKQIKGYKAHITNWIGTRDPEHKIMGDKRFHQDRRNKMYTNNEYLLHSHVQSLLLNG
jgi:hypothetical protein